MGLPHVFKAEQLFNRVLDICVLFPARASSAIRSIQGVVLTRVAAKIALHNSVITSIFTQLFITGANRVSNW